MPVAVPQQTSTISLLAATPFKSSRQQGFVAGLVLILASLALYNPAGRHPFINYDDDRYLSDNAHVKFGLSWQSVKWAFTSYDESNWHPVTWLSHMLDCDLFQLNPAGHHYTNIVWHALNVALLFWLLYSTTGFLWRSFMVAALFGLHPINVESVAWVAERKNVLSLFFFLLTLLAYNRYASRPGIKRYSLVAVLFALALMAKPQVITLPFVLLLWDYWPLQRNKSNNLDSGLAEEHEFEPKPWSWLIAEKLPLLAMCVASSILTLKAQRAAGAVTSYSRYPLSIRLANAVVSYARYLGKALWPSHLSLMYPYQPASLTKWQIALSALLLISISAGVVASKKRYPIVGWFWLLGTMVPMIGIVQVGVQAMADRYAYLPFIGLFVAICWGVADFAKNHSSSSKWLAAASAVLLAAVVVVSHRQLGYWSSSLALWTHAAEVTTDNFVAEDGIGNALLDQGDLEQAMPHFQRAAAIHPSDPISNSNIAFYKSRHGDLTGALAQYKTVTDNTVDERSRANAFVNMGFIDHKLGNFAAAKDHFQAAVNLRPRNVRAWIGLGAACQKLGKPDAAISAYSLAVQLQPSDLTYLLLAGALQQIGRDSEASSATQMAEHLSENMVQARQFAASFVNP